MLSILLPTFLACFEKPIDLDPGVDPSILEECEDIERLNIADENILDVVDSNHEFAFDIYEELRSTNDNVFLSPYSISTALGMLHLGAAENTEEQMSDMLGVFPEDSDSWHGGQGSLVQEFDLGNNCNYKLAVANRAYLQTGYSFQPTFLDDLRLHYNSELGELDFADNPEAARSNINDWVAEKTNEHIPELFPSGTITNSTKLVLTNAIYMDAPWQDSFDPANTHQGNFNLADGSTTTVDMMYRSEVRFSIGYQDDFQIVEIPYDGNDLVFTAIIPHDSDGLMAIEDRIDLDNWNDWKSSMYMTEGEVSMPKFEMRYKEILNDTLKKLGMTDAFSDAANFSGISEEGAPKVNVVVHEAWLKVSEEGTEAAAATGVGVTDTSIGDAIYMNRPFLFFIEDKLSGSILFMGKLADPSQL